jgi:uncharacterized hydrophobic protein (TIGR00271 family)
MHSPSEMKVRSGKVRFNADYLQAFEDKMFIEGPRTGRLRTNFFVLLLLATVIATYGVLSKSTATVIGAMIVAPLMSPIMATAAAVVMGSSRRALRSLSLVAAGVAAVILVSSALTWIEPDVVISFTENGEIASRTSPGLYALLTALGAGAAGAFIMSREEISDSMGGVAIAISLVPPLCVVGIALSQREWGAAGGAMLLFLTNFLAILLAGGVVFMLSGLGRIASGDREARMRRQVFGFIVIATLIVAVPLALTSRSAIVDALDERAATGATQEWLRGTPGHLASLDVADRVVKLTVEGSGELRPLKELADALAATLERPVVVSLRTIPTQSEASSSD